MTDRRVLGVAAVTGILLAVSGCGLGGAKVHDQRSFDAPDERLMIDTPNGELSVVSGDGDKVRVERWVSENADATWAMDGDTLRLETDGQILDFNDGARYEVEVPDGIAVEIQDTNGDIDVAGLTSGLAVDGENGDIKVQNVTGGELDLRSTNGDITLDQSEALDSLALESQNGDVTVSLGGDQAYRIDTQTTNGDENVSVDTDPDADRTLTATTTNGDVTVKKG